MEDTPSVTPDAPKNVKVETVESGNENIGAPTASWFQDLLQGHFKVGSNRGGGGGSEGGGQD